MPLSFTKCLLIFCLSALLCACGGPPRVEDPFFLASSKDSLARGNDWYQKGCYAQALSFFQESLIAARLSDNVPLIVLSYNAQGAALMSMGNLNAAADRLQAALELSLGTEGNPGLAEVLGNLGTVAYKINRPEEAKEYWSRASNFALNQGASPASYLASLARAYFLEGKKEEFTAALAEATGFLEHPDTLPLARSDILNLLASQALEERNFTAALDYLNQALEIDRANEYQEGLAQDLELMAQLHLLGGDAEAAAQNFSRAFYLRAALHDRARTRDIYNKLTELKKNHSISLDLSPLKLILDKPENFDPFPALCPD